MSISTEQREWMESYARFGYMAKGVVYLTVGLTAGWAAWSGGRPEGSEAALRHMKAEAEAMRAELASKNIELQTVIRNQ